MTHLKVWLAHLHSSCGKGGDDLSWIYRTDTHLCPLLCPDQLPFALNNFLKANLSTFVSSNPCLNSGTGIYQRNEPINRRWRGFVCIEKLTLILIVLYEGDQS
jgi:hypothetical protein